MRSRPMSRTTRIPRRYTWRRAATTAWLWTILLTFVCPHIAHAEDRIELRSVYVIPKDAAYALHGQIIFSLPQGARKAIEEGATFNLFIEANIRRKRSFWYDATEADVQQQYEVVYHAISARYLVRNLTKGDQESFATLDAAMNRLSTLDGLPLAATTAVSPEKSENEVSVRATLLVRSLPKALRILLFWTNDWQQTSDWYTWTLRP